MSFEQFTKQMVQQSPLLLVYVVGLILALVNWRRCPGPCLMATLGFAMFLFVTVAMPFIQDSVISSARNSNSSGASLSDRLTTLWTVSNVVRAGGFGLLLAAIFGGRARASVGAFPMMPSSSMPPQMPPGAAGYGQWPYRHG